TKRTLLLTWAGLPPAGSRQLCLAHSFNHLVGAGEQTIPHGEAEGLCGFEVDHQLILRRRLHWQIGGLLTLEDAIDVAGRIPELLYEIGAVGHKAAGSNKDAIPVDRR